MPFRLSVTENSQVSNVTEDAEIKFDKKLNILVAEDNHINRFIIEKMLLDWGLNADFAATGTEAVTKSSQKNYDIILMDIEMPDMNGYKATEIIRQFETPVKDIPIIAMTGHAMSGELEKCLLVGMNDYISKPFKAEELKKKICLLTGMENCVANSEHKQSQVNQTSNTNTTSSGTSIPTKEQSIEEKPIIKFTNMTFLKEISENNDQFYREFIQMFLTNTPNSIQDMIQAHQTQNWEALRQAAHKVKPSFNYVGLKDLNQAAAKIEEIAKQNANFDQLPALLKQINEVAAHAFVELEEELQLISIS
jgi:CheY-like chemotaxis protein